MIRSIFSPMTVRTFDTSATTVAVKLTKVLNGQLLAFFMRPDPRLSIPYVGDGLTADVIQTLCDATEKEGKEATRSAMDHIEGLCKKMAVNYKEGSESDKSMNPPAAYFEGKICYLKEKVGRMARVADLSVVPQPNDKNSPDGEDMLNELILGSGRPLMMVPEGNFKVTGHTVMIAWNGRSESARAVAAALPILHEASKIIAITIGSDHVGRPSLQELARYLKIHGLDMEEMQVKNSGAAIGEQLLKSAADKGVNLLVSGAYSHSRWREKILGGVTKYIVQHAKIPLFMSH